MLKLLVPTGFAPGAEYRGQGAFCRSELPADGSEAVAQRWVAARSGDKAVLVFTDFTYGSDYSDGTIRLNLLRTAAYAAHPILDRPLLPADRALARMDRGLRRFSFRVEVGSAKLLDSADLRGLERGEKPWAISFFPPGSGKPDGRDHNSKGYTMWMAGGGVRGGFSFGSTDEHGGKAVEDVMHVHDLHATVLALLGLDHEKLTYKYAGRDFRLTDVYGKVAKPIFA